MPAGRSSPLHIIERLPLLDRLNAGMNSPLTVVWGQAGSGKSVLLSQWTRSHPESSIVWVGVTPADDDPVHFARHLLTALVAADARFADIGALVSMGTGGMGETLLEALAAQLAETGPMIIVLDDLHAMSNEPLLADIATLVAALPSGVHLVIASRTDLPFAFRRVAGADVAEIRQVDLAMSFADTSELLKRVTGRTITTSNVRTLIEKTEGWVAGLLLAGVSLRGRDDSDSYVAQFAGTDRRVAAYLGEEVLSAQSPERRAALLQMAALDLISAELVADLFHDAIASELFEELERNSMFFVELDDRHGWYRFHHLFGSMLRHRFRADDPGAHSAILLAAADWHLKRGDAPPAIDYLLGAQEWNRALDTILDRGPGVFERGEMATVVRWIALVPQSVLSTRPDVVTISGILMGLDGRAEEAEDILRRIAAAPDTPFGLVVCAQAFIASLAQWRPRPAWSLRQAIRALELVEQLGDRPTPDLLHLSDPRSLETTSHFSGGRALFLLGDMNGARAWLDRALESDGAAYSLWRISALGSLALVEAWCGRTSLAEDLAREAIAIARRVGSLSHPSIGDAYLALTVIAIDAGDHGRAALWLHEGHARAASNGRTQLLWVAHLLRSMIGGVDDSVEALAPPEGPPPPVVADRLLANSNQALRLKGRSSQIRWPSGRPDDPLSSSYMEFVIEELDQGTALPAAVVQAMESADDERMPRLAVQRRLARARRAHRGNDAAESNRLVQEAVAIAEPLQLVEVFAHAGPHLMDRLGAARMGEEFRRAILDSWRRSDGYGRADSPAPVAVNLTVRELEILPYLPTHISNAELAEELFVSVNTIKTHIAHIYDKLGAVGRGDAVKKARTLGLL